MLDAGFPLSIAILAFQQHLAGVHSAWLLAFQGCLMQLLLHTRTHSPWLPYWRLAEMSCCGMGLML